MHADYSKRSPQWKMVRDSIDGQDAIKTAGITYLPKTGGMEANDSTGKQYSAYKGKARFYDLVQAAENGIMGLAFNKSPIIDTPTPDEPVTNDGKTITELLKSELRESIETGRGIMVVDAPVSGGQAYIAEYECESLEDWAVDDNDASKLIAAKFAEQRFEADDVYKSDPEEIKREYVLVDGKAIVRILNEDGEQIEADVVLPLDYLPIFFAGSVDTSPQIDPVPLLPIAEAAVKVYQLTADYYHGIHMTTQGTPWVNGISQDQWELIVKQGMGASALWWLGEDGRAGYIEQTGSGTKDARQAIMDEVARAEGYAIALAEKGGIESAEALRIRSATKHASIYTIMNAVSQATTQALLCKDEWNGRSNSTTMVELSTDFTMLAASEQMLNSINGAVLSGTTPRSVLHNYLREVGLTDKSDDELEGEILDGGGAAQI